MESTYIDKESSTIQDLISKFKEYLETKEAKEIISLKEKEKIEVKNLMEKLRKMDKKSNEFTEWVLYGLLPYSKTKYAKRVSIFPAFLNIKVFFGSYNYDENDWNIIANRIFNLCDKFDKNPDNLGENIKEFTKDKYSRRFQSGSITPILFCLNNNYYLVNNRVRNTYKAIRKLQGLKEKIHRQLEYYPDSIKKLDEFASSLNDDIFNDKGTLDFFCYWYDSKILKKQKEFKKAKVAKKEKEKIEFKEVDFVSFVKNLDFDKLNDYHPPSLDNPERIKMRDIYNLCKKNKWVLPQFQRYFDWKESDVQEFLNSIVKDYYVGSFLLWNVGRYPELGIMPIKGVNKIPDVKPDSIILDGQQRITSIIYAIDSPIFTLKGSRNQLFFYLNFNLYLVQDGSDMIIEKFPYELSLEESFDRLLFPLNNLNKYHDWENKFQKYLIDKYPENINEILQVWTIIHKKLIRLWEGYEIPYVSLSEDIDISQVTDIFEGINTKGKPLGVFDLLIARLYKDKIELKGIWDDTLKKYPIFSDFYNKIQKLPEYIFQAMSLAYTKAGSCKRRDILNINQNFIDNELSFEERWLEISDFINRAIKRITRKNVDGYGAKDRNELPFAPMIPIVAALLREIDKNYNQNACFKKLDTWYWASVFSNAYSSAVDSTLTSDYKEMAEWFSDDEKIAKTIVIAKRELINLFLTEVQTQSGARYKGVMSILALHGSKDFLTGQTLEEAPSNEKHHLFPKSIDKSRNINSVLNMAWMSKKTNGYISNKKPSEYIPKIINEYYQGDKKRFIELLSTHLINEKAYDKLINDDFDGFISEREKLIMTKIRELLGIKEELDDTKLITPKDPFDNKLLFGDTIKTCEEYIYWIDKYFSINGLRFLKEFADKDKVKVIKILTSLKFADFDFRKWFIDFKRSMLQNGIKCELRVITDNNVFKQIHDRWILSRYQNYNIPSPDIVSRGQYSEIKKTDAKLPFESWWNIITRYY